MIDSFNYQTFRPATIAINNKKRNLWDLEENKGFILVSKNGRRYKIINKTNNNNNSLASEYINSLYEYMYMLKKVMLREINNNQIFDTEVKRNGAILFIITPCTLQEIPDNNVFDGINKPKNLVYYTGKLKQFLQDNEYRAGRRHIMLRIRNKTGDMRNKVEIKKLLIHELAHTMCNHCTYRDKENHLSNFDECEELLKYFDSILINYFPDIK